MVAEVASEPENSVVAWIRPEWVRTESIIYAKFIVLGAPKPKARPRTVRNPHTGFVQTFTPDTTVTWEQAIGWQVKQALSVVALDDPKGLEFLPLEGRLMIDMRFNLKRPKSLSKKVEYPMTARGDYDNLAKSVTDALQGINVIADDKTVTDSTILKRFADQDHPEGVEIEMTAWLT